MLKEEFDKLNPATIGAAIEKKNQQHAAFLVRVKLSTPENALADAQKTPVMIHVTRPQLEMLNGLLAGQGLTERDDLMKLLSRSEKRFDPGHLAVDAVLAAREPKPGDETMSLVGFDVWNKLVDHGLKGMAPDVRPGIENNLRTYYLEPYNPTPPADDFEIFKHLHI
jgi:hypothetical protein